MPYLNIVVLKPSKYGPDGYVERFWKGFMPNSTVHFIKSMIPAFIGETATRVHTVDEYVHTDLDYLDLLNAKKRGPTLLLLVGVQSHQFQRALDLAAFAKKRGSMAVIGGPHPMTCDTTMLQGRGVAFAQAEAELILPTILNDATHGELRDFYGSEQRWAEALESPVLIPPSKSELRRTVAGMLGLYPYRGCPFICNFCSVIMIAGRKVRDEPVQNTLENIRIAKAAGVKRVMFTSDNLNKAPTIRELLNRMIEERLQIPFFCQCDTQISNQPELVELLAKAGCFSIFVGAESFDRKVLLAAHKAQNKPEKYAQIVSHCNQWGVLAHFSNIIGFPQNNEADVLEHLRVLKELDPGAASFYILSPIPGTEQYDDFRARDIITEHNLDRFDGTNLVWEHDHFSKEELAQLLMRCYREFYTFRQARSRVRYFRNKPCPQLPANMMANYGYSAFTRWCALRGKHPMSGGVWQRKLDGVSDYLSLRASTYGYSLVPLPKSLRLSAADEAFNKVNARTA